MNLFHHSILFWQRHSKRYITRIFLTLINFLNLALSAMVSVWMISISSYVEILKNIAYNKSTEGAHARIAASGVVIT